MRQPDERLLRRTLHFGMEQMIEMVLIVGLLMGLVMEVVMDLMESLVMNLVHGEVMERPARPIKMRTTKTERKGTVAKKIKEMMQMIRKRGDYERVLWFLKLYKVKSLHVSVALEV